MRLINADELIERMYHDAFETDTDMQKWDSGCWIRYKMFENAMDSAPTVDAVEIVRCKDCKFGVYEKGRGIYHIRCEILEFLFQDDDYCSYGERREE